MPISKSAIKKAKWKTKNGKRKPMSRYPDNVNPYGATLFIERDIGDKTLELQVLAPPRHRAERSTLTRKIELASACIRFDWLKLEQNRIASSQIVFFGTAQRDRWYEDFCHKIGAVALALPSARSTTDAFAFFEDDDAAMLALLTYG
jgi:hypothetical protein